MVISLSRAIRQGAGDDPLVAALAALHRDFSPASPESACAMTLHALHSVWPHLGATVRTWPRLAEAVERMVPAPINAVRQPPNSYRLDVHCSLYKFITHAHDRCQWPNVKIADLLETSRL
jgi:hypothetical protein